MRRSKRPPARAREVMDVADPFHGDRTLHSRFEIKYLLPAKQVPAIRRFIQPFVRPDSFAVRRPGYTYPICSLYLDDRDFRLCRTTMQGLKNRFKLRVRSYSDDPLEPVYCEIKRRVDRIIIKDRACIDREHLRTLLDGRLPRIAGLGARGQASLTGFHALALSMQARPVVRIRYMREAYEGSAGEPLRVTFDTLVQWQLTRGPEVSSGGEGWSETPVDGTILEVKFTNCYPSWVNRMVQVFQLRQQSVAKYVMSIEATGRLQGIVPAPRIARGPSRGRQGLPAAPGHTEAA